MKQGTVLQYLGRGGKFCPEKHRPTHWHGEDSNCLGMSQFGPKPGAEIEGNWSYNHYYREIDLRPRLQGEEPATGESFLGWEKSDGPWFRRLQLYDEEYWLPMLPAPDQLLISPPTPDQTREDKLEAVLKTLVEQCGGETAAKMADALIEAKNLLES